MFSEFRFAARALVRWRSGAVAAALTLAAGIGTATALYALTRVVLADMPGVPGVDRMARVYATSPALGVERGPVTLPEFDRLLSNAASFQAIGGYAGQDTVVGQGSSARPAVAGYASPGFFTAMAVPPAEGRVFTAADLGGPPVVIVSDGLWRREFAGRHLDGATLLVDGIERAVVGVMPPQFHYPFVGMVADLWVPLTRASVEMPAIVSIYARLRNGVDWTAAQAELASLPREKNQWTWQAIPIARDARKRSAAAYAGTMGPAVLVLLIACVNVACLLMARGIAREKELTVRRALGSTRAGVLRLLLVESAVLALVSGAIGTALAVWILRVLGAKLAAFQPAMAASLAVDVRLLPVALTASATACLVFGVVPALRLSRRDVAGSLNGVPARHTIDIAGYGARDVIVFAEVAAAVGFVVWTAMIYTLFAELNGVKLQFAADRVIAMRVPASSVQDVAARVAAIPGVARTAISSGMLGGGTRERAMVRGGAAVMISSIPVGGEFLDTLGVPLVRGRRFDASEQHATAGVAIVTERGARMLARDGNALGLHLDTRTRGELVIIGICRDPVDYGAVAMVDEGAAAEIYVPYGPAVGSREAVVLARTAGDAHGALAAIAAAARTPPGTRPVRPLVLSDDFQQRAGAGAMVAVRVLGAFAILSLLLAGTGVFAVINQSVAQRRREFGIRLAIGATPGRVLRLVLIREGKLIAAAVATGVIFTMLATRALFSALVQLTAIVPAWWIGALALSGGVAAIAVVFATRKIVRLEPAAVLRRL